MNHVTAARDRSQPTISVIVNTCDRCNELRTLLYALNHQTYSNFEVVVVLGPTQDESLQMLADEHGDRVHVVRCPQFNLSCSRNLGLAHAAGEVVAFIDDDAIPAPTWLAQLAAAYGDASVAGVGGRTYAIRPEASMIQFLSGKFSVLAEQEDVRWDEQAAVISTTPERFWFPRFHGTNMSYRRQALLAINGFDECFEYLFDDSDIGVRLGLAGFKLHQLREGFVYHVPGWGRNRGKHPYDLNWYCWLRSTIYFALKNGRPTVGLRASLVRAGRIISGFHAQIDELRRRDRLPPEIHSKARKMLRRGSIIGVLQGLLARRRLHTRIELVDRKLKPFLRSDSSRFPVVPATGIPAGQRPSPGADRPLRICLLCSELPPRSARWDARLIPVLAQGLARLGHEVHIITTGTQKRVTFKDGAYVHEVDSTGSNRYRNLAAQGYPALATWLCHGHVVKEKIVSLHCNHRLDIIDTPMWQLQGLVATVAGSVPVVLRIGPGDIGCFKGHPLVPENESELLDDLAGELLQRAVAVVTSSKEDVQALEERYEERITGTVKVIAGLAALPGRWQKRDDGIDSATVVAGEMVDLYRAVLGSRGQLF
jgi:glycosyltransferase involved in cell wall biosynthesis